jgi:predicted nucleotidyltransferase
MLNKEAVIKVLKKNKDMFQDKYGVTAMYLYGSFSKNKASDTSDVDLLVETPRRYKKYKNYLEMKYFLQKIFNREVDLVYLDSLNPVIKEEIKGETIKIE